MPYICWSHSPALLAVSSLSIVTVINPILDQEFMTARFKICKNFIEFKKNLTFVKICYMCVLYVCH